jgi:hypothetical protein
VKLRLEEPKLGTLRLETHYGYRVAKLDLGFPVARAVAEDRVNANGQIDSTALYGARAVSLALAVVGNSDGETGEVDTRRNLLDRLRAFASPARRPYLYVDDEDGSVERRVLLRGDQAGAPLEIPGSAQVTVVWVAPAGILEHGVQQTVSVSAVLPSDPGRTYDKTYSVSYPKQSSVGSKGVENIGTEPAAPVYRIFGPCTNPTIINPDTGDVLAFGGTAVTGTVTLTESQFIEVDVTAATAFYNGDPTASAYSAIDFVRSTFAWLAPGANRLRLVTSSYQGDARLEVMYRSAWI